MPLDREALETLEVSPAQVQAGRRGHRRRRWLLLALIVIGLAGASWFFMPRATPVRVTEATLQSAGAVRVLNASGYVVARRMATVSSKSTGKITAVNVEEGMHVAAGQVVARLEDDVARARVTIAKAELASAKAAVAEAQARLEVAGLKRDRARRLVTKGAQTQAVLDQAVADYRVAQATLDGARAQVQQATGQLAMNRQTLDDTYIRAPFAGVVVSKDAQPGEIVSPISAGGGFTRTGICTIVDMRSLEVEVDVNEAYIERVHEGQRVQAVLDAYPDWKIPAHVINIVPTADRDKSTVKVRIGFNRLDPRMLPEMAVQVWFLATGGDNRKALFVPTAALHADGDRAYVFVIRDGLAHRVPVVAGGESGKRTEIKSGLKPGAPVIVSAGSKLSDGQSVRREG